MRRIHPAARAIMRQVANAYQIPVENINHGSHRKPYPNIRKEIAHRLRTERGWSLKQIGAALNVHHSSVVAMLQTYKPPAHPPVVEEPIVTAVTIKAEADYYGTMPPKLTGAISNLIKQHLAAAGLHNIEVHGHTQCR